jgi:hypothetical protein
MGDSGDLFGFGTINNGLGDSDLGQIPREFATRTNAAIAQWDAMKAVAQKLPAAQFDIFMTRANAEGMRVPRRVAQLRAGDFDGANIFGQVDSGRLEKVERGLAILSDLLVSLQAAVGQRDVAVSTGPRQVETKLVPVDRIPTEVWVIGGAAVIGLTALLLLKK